MRNLFRTTTFLAIVACLLWSTAFAGVKIGLEYHSPFQFAGIRFTISGLLMFLYFGKPKRYFSEFKQNIKFILLLSVVQIFAQYALFYSGINLLPGSLSAMIVGSQPLFIALVAHFSFNNDKMTPLKTFSILIGVVGISIITLGRSKVEMSGYLEYIGIAILLVNNIVSGYSNVLVAKHTGTISPVVLSSTSLIIGGLMLSVVSIPVEGVHLGPFPPEYWYALAWLSFLSAAAITIWYSLLKRPGVKVSLLNVWKFLIPVSGAALSWVLLSNEKPDFVSITGMVVIAVSLLSLNYANRREQKLAAQKE
ncbi:DMT family transporter [Draconibacterium sp. IB214405]|uniref:DMT family transporter n=1 Tax=Draconibacterium sp. IB214405 TaxID=3097352 RepID=UPI002A13EA84|nr:DMT family transporter [Draconibacterium sp. IB214405]MDX8340586.1 DMT family transporter [Draconibacterium sp. IB214405]